MKRFLLSVLLVGAASAAHAQYFGLKGGVNAAVLDGEQIQASTKYNTSWHAGAFYNYNLVGPLSLRPEVQYSVQGSEFKSSDEDYTTQLYYLAVPVLLDLKLGPVHLQGGPQFGVLLQAEQKGTKVVRVNNGAPEYGSVQQQVTDQFKRQDFSLCAGAEVDLGRTFAVGGRFNAGLNDVADYRDIRSVNDARLKNRVIQGYLAIKFGGSR
ncbi:PorT family protein [Hymenobacter sp. 15J16-1T3B]|uniref:porin family protein n=1 Tax=Hymenobacter sp. 15J16-1T3B TaxID=2886941 RepID=UPI001D11B41C|nr:porin family protein [Hymenobacter sp. 15J16-1T3B]MCC3155883.1 PorT family protein [Hymenobacter sp. 15J16-1T3B]